ncbi:DUF937 domain-containing protein [Spirosoma areae]
MAVHLVAYLKDQFTPAVVDQLSGQLNETSANTLKAINSALPTLLGGLTRRIQETDGPSSIISFLDKGNYEEAPPEISQIIARNQVATSVTVGNTFIDKIFGNKGPKVTELISSYSSTKPQTSLTILGLAGSALMSVLGRQEQEKGLTAENLKTLLLGQADEFRQALPTGLEAIQDLLGFDQLNTPAGPQTLVQGADNLSGSPVNPNIPKSTEGERRTENVRWLRWAMIAIAVLVLALLVQKCRQNQNGSDGVSTDSTSRVESNAVEDTSAATRQSIRDANGQPTDSTAPGPLGIRDSTQQR